VTGDSDQSFSVFTAIKINFFSYFLGNYKYQADQI